MFAYLIQNVMDVSAEHISRLFGYFRFDQGNIGKRGRALIQACSLFSFTDKPCLRSVTVSDEGQLPYCSFCACSVYNQQDLVRIFAGELDEEGAVLYWTLDDGTGEVVFAEAGQDICAVSQ